MRHAAKSNLEVRHLMRGKMFDGSFQVLYPSTFKNLIFIGCCCKRTL